MNIEELLQQYPTKRVKPVDGLAVTAEVWEDAHQYHRQTQGFNMLFSQGSGILVGLEVIASDPPDTSVYILPGLAIDPAGQTIVLPQPVAYDIGQEMEGQLYLLLSYGESQPRADEDRQADGSPLYIHSEFSIFARTTLPNTPWVELARVSRSSPDAVFGNTQNPAQPGPDELDLRYRRQVGAPPEVSLAVSYLGEVKDKQQGRGASYLAQALNQMGHYHITVQDDVPLGPNIVTNTLVYLVGQGDFKLEESLRNGLRNYVRRGNGTLLIESLDSAAEKAFLNFLGTTKLQPEPVPSGHRLLTRPNLFAAPPPGYGDEAKSKLLVGEGVVFSTYNYGLLWQGDRKGQKASREEIRSALEWGGNLITYAMERRR